jgi:putative ABC transport system permease protein
VEAFREELLRRVSAIPGVKFAGTNSAPPLGILSQGTDFEIEGKPRGGPKKPFAEFGNVSTGYLSAMGIPLLRGRHFLESDRPDSPPVAIISESVARRYFAGEEPLGKGLRLGRLDASPVFTIVGIVTDVRAWVEKAPVGTIYALSAQLPESEQGSRASRFVVLSVRTATDPGAIASAVRRAVAEIDKDQPVADVMTMRQAVGKALAGRTLNTLVFALFAGLALVLAAVGVIGLVAYSVAHRTNEIGIRMALGARPTAVLGMVVGEMLRPATAGVVIGIAASFAASRLLASMLYGVKPTAPHVLAAAAGCLVAAVLVATVLAARKAMRLDPVTVLRRE